MPRFASVLLAATLIASPASGAVHFIKWNHANGSGDERNVAATTSTRESPSGRRG